MFYAVTVKKMRVGVGESPDDGTYPTIDLFYDDNGIGQVMPVLKEIEKHNQFPMLFMFEEGGRTEVIVLFLLKNPTPQLLRQVLPGSKVVQVGELEPNNTTLLMTAESDFRRSGPGVIPFFDMWDERKFVRIFVYSETETKTSVWGCQITRIERESPY